jgi:hypothetical protein
MRLLFAALMMAMLASPAYSQMSLGNKKEKTPLDLKYEREENERKENERGYNDQMKRLKGQGPAATNSDPWKGVRSSTDSNAKR